MGAADEACEPLPLVEYPDAYQVGPSCCVHPCARAKGGRGGVARERAVGGLVAVVLHCCFSSWGRHSSAGQGVW
jgi:hypothetical protein